jgi:FixJ family two-component response regulator
MTTTGTVYIVDDDEMTRRGTARLLEAAGFQTRAYSGAPDLLAAVDRDTTGCIVLDVRMPGQSGLELQVVLAERDVWLPIVFMTGHGEIPDTVRAMQRGAVDFLTKPVDGTILMGAVARALALDASARAARAHRERLRLRFERLTPREREVFLHLISGQLNKQVASELQISERTIKLHRSRVFEKLEVESMAEMARLAADLGINPAPPGP